MISAPQYSHTPKRIQFVFFYPRNFTQSFRLFAHLRFSVLLAIFCAAPWKMCSGKMAKNCFVSDGKGQQQQLPVCTLAAEPNVTAKFATVFVCICMCVWKGVSGCIAFSTTLRLCSCRASRFVVAVLYLHSIFFYFVLQAFIVTALALHLFVGLKGVLHLRLPRRRLWWLKGVIHLGTSEVRHTSTMLYGRL